MKKQTGIKITAKMVRRANRILNQDIDGMFAFLRFCGCCYWAEGHLRRLVGGRFRTMPNKWTQKRWKEWSLLVNRRKARK